MNENEKVITDTNVSETVKKDDEKKSKKIKKNKNSLMFDVGKLKADNEKLEDLVFNKKEIIIELEKSREKERIDFLMSLLDIYKALRETRDDVESITTETIEAKKEKILKDVKTTMLFMFPSDKEYDDLRETFKQSFGRESVHTEPTEDEIAEFERINLKETDKIIDFKSGKEKLAKKSKKK